MGTQPFPTVLFSPYIKDVFMFGIQRPAQLVCVGDHHCYFCSECCIGGKSMVTRRVNRLLALPMNASLDRPQPLFFNVCV